MFLSLKTVMFVLVSMALFVFRMALNRHETAASHRRSTTLLESSITVLASVVIVFDCPIEWLSLLIDWPVWIVLSDIRQVTCCFGHWAIACIV